VEAKYPALLFKQQLDAFVQKIFPMLRDNVKKEVTPQLAACIHAPRAATTRSRRGSGVPSAGPGDGPGAPPARMHARKARSRRAFAAALGSWVVRQHPCPQAWTAPMRRHAACPFPSSPLPRTGL
jgi:hypothetical protein